MALSWKDRVKQAVTAGGTGALTLGSAASGHQALAAGDDGLLFAYVIEDGAAWETGEGIYTNTGTSFARTIRFASSTGSALTVSTSAFVYININSTVAQGMDIAAQSIIPGGRLTLTTGVPVTTSDVTGATTVYYTPHVHNGIALWDGNRWQPVIFAETSLALGTLTNALPYDVFGFLSSGVLATELLAWTNGTTRATAVTLQDGRYCKSGVKTRLYLGTFYTTATTTTEDSAAKRLIYNFYNRERRQLVRKEAAASWTYSSATIRQANANTANQVEVISGIAGSSFIDLALDVAISTSVTSAAVSGFGEDSITAYSSDCRTAYCQVSLTLNAVAVLRKQVPLGYHKYTWLEGNQADSGATTYYQSSAPYDGGIAGFVEA